MVESNWPTDFSRLTHQTVLKNQNYYGIVPVLDVQNTFDAYIKIRQGRFKWVELIEDPETKNFSFTDRVADHQNELVEYPTDNINDIIDIVSKIYIKFDYTDPITQQFAKDINSNFSVKVIEDYLNCKIDIPVTSENISSALMLMLYSGYTR